MDGTLREPLSGQQHFQNPQDQQIIVGADIAIRAYKDDWIIVGITNQGGVAAGHKSMQQCIKEQQYTLELFPQLREIYFCPDFEGRKCFRVTRHNAHNQLLINILQSDVPTTQSDCRNSLSCATKSSV